MEQEKQPSQYELTRRKIVDAIVAKVRDDSLGEQLLFTLQDIMPDHEHETRNLHSETLRALCHYAAIAAGEQTNTAIGYTPERIETVEDESNPYKKIEPTVIRNEFIVLPRAEQRDVKRGITYEPVSEYDLKRRKQHARIKKKESSNDSDIIHIQPQDNQRNRKRQIPSFVSNIVNNRRSY